MDKTRTLFGLCLILFVFLGLVLFTSGCTTVNTSDDEVDDNGKKGDNMDNANTIVVFETSKGNFEVELDKEKAPVTVANFLTYVNEGFFDGTVFHRVIKGFMIQGGGFTPDANQKQTKDPIKLESDNGLKNLKGTVAMARTNVPDSATSQFFVNAVDNAFLDYTPSNPGYAVFGKVTGGMDVVMAIEGVATVNKGSHQNWPVEDVIINKAYLKE